MPRGMEGETVPALLILLPSGTRPPRPTTGRVPGSQRRHLADAIGQTQETANPWSPGGQSVWMTPPSRRLK